MRTIQYVYSDNTGEHLVSAEVYSFRTAYQEILQIIDWFNHIEKGKHWMGTTFPNCRKFVQLIGTNGVKRHTGWKSLIY